eukprot:11229176-Alexandrium_andersonii.AAC.1
MGLASLSVHAQRFAFGMGDVTRGRASGIAMLPPEPAGPPSLAKERSPASHGCTGWLCSGRGPLLGHLPFRMWCGHSLEASA